MGLSQWLSGIESAFKSGGRVQSLMQENPTCGSATKSVRHNYRPVYTISAAWEPYSLGSAAREATAEKPEHPS